MLNKGCIEGTLLRFQFSHLPEGDNLVKNMLKQEVRQNSTTEATNQHSEIITSECFKNCEVLSHFILPFTSLCYYILLLFSNTEICFITHIKLHLMDYLRRAKKDKTSP